MTSPTDFEATFELAGQSVTYYSLVKAEAFGLGGFGKLPKSLKVLGENLLRNCDKLAVHEDDIRDLGAGRAIRRWSARSRTICTYPDAGHVGDTASGRPIGNA